MNAYEEPTRVQIYEEDWEHVKIASAISRGTTAQKMGGNMIATLVSEPLAQPLTEPTGPVKRRAVWIRLPVDAREAVDKIRNDDQNATWARLLHHYNHHRPHTACGNLTPFTRLTNVPGQYT